MRDDKYKIVPDAPLLGIRYWVQWYIKRVPKFEIFEYIGKDQDKELYFFKSRSEGTVLGRRFSELNKFGFRPFLLDISKIEPYYFGENKN